ncbi:MULTISPECIES: SDR family oxidoreductase [Rhizobiaceae]|uniref:NAD(P)H dehydrogenase (Quinone) n=1 Tax=Aliirhizobium cellulosilyticum TaxID=393664 RepID=A0A7W6Y2D9_9HYPH|nr:SDR family oxidoreductase [Rhizobium cellulosilyticum]MBB4347608.1 NAD(P)H dehydrogenase (quinone) [Rhizobium cellulosilyticum]MBB4409997.1 NAD(P)H dehydrogenase (quinone) [Rhizobium cellulosilyticum]MBB4444684.1 NAD(P)H dehydrogenase (quinone) [Rhizobium cellulosilyticum]
MTKLLVTGAAGQLGRAVLNHLLETSKVSPGDIVAASRDTSKLADLAAKGVETRKADFTDEAGLAAAFAGIDRVLIISTDDLATPGNRLKQHKTAVAAATKAGVKHILYTSMPNPDKSLVSFAPDHLGTEEAIKATGIAYTILRNAWYDDNYLMSMPHNLETGTWYTAYGAGKVSNISRDDCARAAAAALANPPAGSTTLTLTGSESLNAEEIAALVSKASGKQLNVVHVTDEQLAGGLTSAGLPDFLVKMLVSADANIRAGNFDLVTSDFEKLTGSKPQPLSGYLANNKDALLSAH